MQDVALGSNNRFMVFMSFRLPLLLALLLPLLHARCVYTQPEQKGALPYAVDVEEFALNYTMTACSQYVDGPLCCNEANAKLTADNLKQLDGVFSTASGGCDVCAVNLKRFWCEYACSPRQADFLKVSKEYYVYPDPMKPGQTIVAQEANLTVQATTACAIYNSCKRVPFVTSVSAMGSPAGFLNFQGHNAIDNALQNINVFFTYDKNKGLYFNNATGANKTSQPTPCNYKGKQLHGFNCTACSCNTCEEACDSSEGFHYEESGVLEDFNYVLVGGIWGGAIALAAALTLFRHLRQKTKTH